MITVDITTKDGVYRHLKASGHAYSGEPGFDLVCAGVSSVLTGALNGFDTLDDTVEVSLTSEPLVEINIKNENTLNQKLFEFLLIQLKTIEFSNSEYITINEKEDVR
ncbi:ribosomal-processing cysteine protease Prp [Erysipelothrix sp. HDW6A]|uniref:ribosomal-processing cysteine protease Prp n=1 Tax=Erysipelothrix sp. HDW6A TaxID=2714928 RepID=UPI00140C18A1|nr:ribosomal-processing cysteine protease Prp [Erysipelothrix sp. HDW6A]QIK57482.1 ribosomal-processing cysteine protease Prp [Erysipelothrix sp. HDW6A]